MTQKFLSRKKMTRKVALVAMAIWIRVRTWKGSV
jgi:hypothetical protein